MINKPSLLDTPNLINMKEYTPSPIPGESVDDCYAWDSLIRGDYNTGYAPDWDEGKLIQETLPAAQWDAFIHDLTAYGWETTQLLTSLWEEMYCLIHGSTVGYDQEAVTQLLSGAQTFTNKTINFADNTLTGVASTDTAQTLKNKTISFDDNTLQNVASLDTAQTLKNKTIDSQYNTLTIEKKQATVTCLPTVYSTSQTVTPTKEMNIQIDTASVVLTLGTGPYIGYTVPVTATAACSVTYTGANGVVTDSFDVGQTINYIWKGSYWGSVSNASLPVFINSSQTVSPTMDMNYVISTAAVNLTLANGARIGHKIAVTATADGAVTYLGVNGSTTQAIGTGYRCELTWNGSYWLMAMFSVIEGIDAAGSPFQFGGEVSVAPVPSDGPIVITTNGATLDPTEGNKFLLNITSANASCSLDTGSSLFQNVTVINKNSYAVKVTYSGSLGVMTAVIPSGGQFLFIWEGTYWSSFETPVVYVTETETRNITTEKVIMLDANNITLTLGSAPYRGYVVIVQGGANVSNVSYVHYTHSQIGAFTDIIRGGDKVVYTYTGPNWSSELIPRAGLQEFSSLSEVRTNKYWIDGKPIHRRTIADTATHTNSGSETTLLLYSDTDNTIDTFIRAYGSMKITSWINVPYATANARVSLYFTIGVGLRLIYTLPGSITTFSGIYITFEYTMN